MHEAVNAYYDSFEEVLRVQKAGGASEPTPLMKQTMSGMYLKIMTSAVRASAGYRVEGTSRIEGYSVGAQTPDRIPISGCENQTDIKVTEKKSGKRVKPRNSGLRVRKVMAVKGADGHWRIDRFVSEKYFDPDDWDTRPCATTERPPS